MRPRAIHQILPFFAYGDAVGNQALAMRDLLRGAGHASDIFAENCDRRLERQCHPYRDYGRYTNSENFLIFHYSTHGQVSSYVAGLRDRVVLYYHNVTPPRFFHWINGELARDLEEARQALGSWADQVPAIAASFYNAQELEALNFQVLGIAPYIMQFRQLDEGLTGRGAAQILRQFSDPNMFDWLFVGRIVPNKRIEDIIRSFYYFHRWMVPSSRLFLVGSSTGAEEYAQTLELLTRRLSLSDSVVFAGHYSAMEGLAAWYKLADLYMCMSEHEGFCIPLVEAMHYELPVIAYAAAGVPFTLGNAGVWVKRKDCPMIAEVAYELKCNEQFRFHILKKQSERLAVFNPETARALVYGTVKTAMDWYDGRTSGKDRVGGLGR